MSGNYVSTPFCFLIPVRVLQQLRDQSQVTISVDSAYHPVYFQASAATDPPQAAVGDGRGIAVYSQGNEPLSNPLLNISITPGSISLTISKRLTQQNASDLYFDIFLWATADIEGNNFGLHLDADSEFTVYYGFFHGMADETMERPGTTTVIQWR